MPTKVVASGTGWHYYIGCYIECYIESSTWQSNMNKILEQILWRYVWEMCTKRERPLMTFKC